MFVTYRSFISQILSLIHIKNSAEPLIHNSSIKTFSRAVTGCHQSRVDTPTGEFMVAELDADWALKQDSQQSALERVS